MRPLQVFLHNLRRTPLGLMAVLCNPLVSFPQEALPPSLPATNGILTAIRLGQDFTDYDWVVSTATADGFGQHD